MCSAPPAPGVTGERGLRLRLFSPAPRHLSLAWPSWDHFRDKLPAPSHPYLRLGFQGGTQTKPRGSGRCLMYVPEATGEGVGKAGVGADARAGEHPGRWEGVWGWS